MMKFSLAEQKKKKNWNPVFFFFFSSQFLFIFFRCALAQVDDTDRKMRDFPTNVVIVPEFKHLVRRDAHCLA